MSRILPIIPGRQVTRPVVACLVGLFLVGAHTSRAQEAPAPAQAPAAVKVEAISAPRVLTTEEKAKNLESFDVVWRTIRDTHYDPKFGGVDWPAVRDEFRPKVEAASTQAEARALMGEAIGRLHLSHFGIIPSEAYKAVEGVKGGPGELGLSVRIVDGHALVTSVLDGSTGSKAGVKPGWVVEQVGSTPMSQVFQEVDKAYKDEGMRPTRKAMGVIRRFQGQVGASCSVDFLDGDDHKVHLDIPFAEPQGVAANFGNLPTFHVRYDSKRLDRTIGYVALNIFFDPARVLNSYAESLEGFKDTEGLIIDLRGNPGGVGVMAIGMGGWLVTEPDQKLGTMITRDSSLNFALNPRSVPYENPVAILVDELSMSTSEILAGGLQDLKRARVFGTKTPGAALPSRFDVLPNGDRFQYAFANYISAGGKPLEGLGVIPDVVAGPSRQALREGRDPAVEAAMSWLRSPRPAP